MLRRSISKDLAEWKQRRHHPLVLSGLRQTGKTFIVNEFGRENYDHVVYLDLRNNTSVHTAFDGDFDVDRMVMDISAVTTGTDFVPGSTLLILDEIQDCPNARSSLKYWDLDGRYDVIATGSFLGVKGFRATYTRGVPVGYEENMVLRPLSFAEFLDNAGISERVTDYVRTCISKGTAVSGTVHERMRSLYYQYIVTGGMPEALNAFFETHDLNRVKKIQRNILTSIRDDFGRYKAEDGTDRINEVLKLRAEACLDSVPAQLSREYKKFKYSEVSVKGHSREKADGLRYIEDVGLVLPAYNLREISAPLEAAAIKSEFKVYYADTGLLVSQLEDGTAALILKGDLSAYKGAIAENTAACALTAAGKSLYYFHDKTGSPELDFIYSEEGVPTIMECKASRTRATSMKFVLEHPGRFGRHPAVKYADTNVGGGDGFATYPLYALGLLKSDDHPFIVPAVDIDAVNANLPE